MKKYIIVFLLTMLATIFICKGGENEIEIVNDLGDLPKVESYVINRDYLSIKLDIGNPVKSAKKDGAVYIKKCLEFLKESNLDTVKTIDFQVFSETTGGNLKTVSAEFKKEITDKINFCNVNLEEIYEYAEYYWSRW